MGSIDVVSSRTQSVGATDSQVYRYRGGSVTGSGKCKYKRQVKGEFGSPVGSGTPNVEGIRKRGEDAFKPYSASLSSMLNVSSADCRYAVQHVVVSH